MGTGGIETLFCTKVAKVGLGTVDNTPVYMTPVIYTVYQQEKKFSVYFYFYIYAIKTKRETGKHYSFETLDCMYP